MYAKPSPIRTLTVGFGFAPNLPNNSPKTTRCWLAGLTKKYQLYISPPVGNYTLPRRSLL